MLAWLGLDRPAQNTPAPSPVRVPKPRRRQGSRRGSRDENGGAFRSPKGDGSVSPRNSAPPAPSTSGAAAPHASARRVVKGKVQRAPRDPLGIPTAPPPVVAVPQGVREADLGEVGIARAARKGGNSEAVD